MEENRPGGRRWGIFFLALLALCGIISGCRAAGTRPKEAADRAGLSDRSGLSDRAGVSGRAGVSDQAETVELDWYINFSWFATEWGESEVAKAITDITGVRVNFQTPKGDEGEKMNAMIGADTLPDLVTLGWSETQNYEMIEKGQVWALNELADQYDPDFYSVLNERVVDWYEQPDGKLYGYPNSFYTPEDYQTGQIASNYTFMVRKDIYEAIGSPDMTTPEGFMEAVRLAAELFPEVDGEPLIPIGSEEFTDEGSNSFGLYLQSFLAVPYEKDGEYYDRNTDPDYLKWLGVFRQLGEEGYLKDEIFIDRRLQISENIEKGRYFCLFFQATDIMNQQRKLIEKNPNSIYMAVPGPANAAGDDPELPISGMYGWTVTYIPKNCKNPERALALLKYLISEEGQKMVFLGVEGSMYEMKDGKAKTKPEVKALLYSDRKAYDRKYGGDNTYWMMQDIAVQQQWWEGTDFAIRQLSEWTYPYTVYTDQYSISFGSDKEGTDLYKKQKRIWGDTLPKLLLAESEEEFGRTLEEYLKIRQENGYGDYTKKVSELYRKNKEKLGLEDREGFKKS